jgi:hypothetical protein
MSAVGTADPNRLRPREWTRQRLNGREVFAANPRRGDADDRAPATESGREQRQLVNERSEGEGKCTEVDSGGLPPVDVDSEKPRGPGR